MAIWALFALAAFAALVWAGRQPNRATAATRLMSGLASGGAAIGAVVAGLKGGWPLSVLLILASVYFGERARTRTGANSSSLQDGSSGMSLADARAILGVGPQSGRAEIEAAYRRLMPRAHPDQGGSAGLAAQLNAARDRLLKS
jgi:hypothetical protein